MKKPFNVPLVVGLLLLSPILATEAIARTYTTNFPKIENPISEGGNWINGKAVGLDWSDVQIIAPGLVVGTQVPYSGSFNGIYNDSVAFLAQPWGADQSVQATVRIVNYPNLANGNEEVEIWLRGSMSAHNLTGYEINFRVANDATNSYTEIVRSNGARGNFTRLSRLVGAQYGIVNGDIIKASIVGTVIRVWKNGIQLVQITDGGLTAGSPGIGFWLRQNPGLPTNYGFKSFMASDVTSNATAASVPTNFTATAAPSFERVRRMRPVYMAVSLPLNLSWTTSRDDVAIPGYTIYDGGRIGTSTTNSLLNGGLSAVGNLSLQSTSASATTSPRAGDMTAPAFRQTSLRRRPLGRRSI